MKVKYDRAEVNVNKICQVLEDHQIQLMKDIAILDKMYDLNLTYFKELSMYILAGKKEAAESTAGRTAAADGEGKTERAAGGCTGGKGYGIPVQPF